MGPPRRKLHQTVEETLTPPDALGDSRQIVRILGAAGKNLYNVETASSEKLLVELAPKFRSTIWLRRGGYVVVDTTALADRDNKLDGEIVNVVRDEKAWRKAPFWPESFTRRVAQTDNEDQESKVGMMPPSDDDEEEGE